MNARHYQVLWELAQKFQLNKFLTVPAFIYILLYPPLYIDVMCVHFKIYFTASTDLLLGVGKSEEDTPSPTRPYITPPSPGFFPAVILQVLFFSSP